MKKTEATCKEDMSYDTTPNMSFRNSSVSSPGASPLPANDGGLGEEDHPTFSVNPFVKSKTAHNKMLLRRRKRSQHPLRELRLKRGFTLEELAELTTLSPSYLSRLESGSRRLNADILQRIATILGCHPGDLLPMDHTAPFKLSSQAPWLSCQEPESLETTNPLYIKDLPLQLLTEDPSSSQRFHLDPAKEPGWIIRPSYLYGTANALAFQVPRSCYGLRYGAHDYIFADPSRLLTPSCYMVAVTHQSTVYIGKFEEWRVPDVTEFADSLLMTVLTIEDRSLEENQVFLKKSEIKSTYRIVGTGEAPRAGETS